MLGISTNGSLREVNNNEEGVTQGYDKEEVHNCGLNLDLAVVHHTQKEVAPGTAELVVGDEASLGQEKTGLDMVVENEKRSKRFHEERRKRCTYTTETKPDTVESDEGRQDTIQPDVLRVQERSRAEVVLQEQEDTIKELIANAQGYRIQLKDKEAEILKEKETVNHLNKHIEFMREEKKQFDRELIAEKQRYLRVYDAGMNVERRLKKEISDKDALLEKLKEENEILKKENAELTTLAGEMGDLKADNIHLSKQVDSLNSLFTELNREGKQNTGVIVHEPVPLNIIQETDEFDQMPATRGRGIPENNVLDDKCQKTQVYKRNRKTVTPSSMTRRVKGRHSKQLLMVSKGEQTGQIDFAQGSNMVQKDGTGKLIEPIHSRVWGLLSPGIRAKLLALQMYSNRSTQVWESEDSSGKLILTAVLVEDLYTGAWISTELVDWYFRWRIPNLSNKYDQIRATQLTDCFCLRAGCYAQWNSDITGKTGCDMVKQDIDSKLSYDTYQSAIFVPLLASETHWILLILDIDLMQWTIYNSLPVAGCKNSTKSVDSFRRYLQKILLPKIKKARKDTTIVFKKDVVQENGPVQQNENDSALFICKYAEHMIRGTSFVGWGQKDIEDLRSEFIENILSTE